MKAAVIAGADGFIGRHLTRRLRDAGTEIWAVVFPGSPTKDMYLGCEGIHTVCTEYSRLNELKDEFPKDPDVFYDFVWQGVNALLRDDLELQMTNIGLTLDCMRFARDIGAAKFVLPGSTSEYLKCGAPINSLALPTPQNAYGSVKVALRYLASALAEQLGLGLIYAVITGIYAADRRDNNVIFYTAEKLLRGEKPSLTRLEQLWDYVYIDDVAEALYLIGEKGRAGSFYAIGRGDNRPLREYIEEIRDIIDPSLPLGIGEVPYKGEGLPGSCIDLTDLRRDTGFEPRVSFSEGIRRVIAAMKQEADI
ncbi:MAG: NAD(P)-dependent oxidoreductase [Oscillospiraceae bacterium]|nr:NAD(P)-dependent oxidoreductase [Oscillospiraceae bacterium]